VKGWEGGMRSLYEEGEVTEEEEEGEEGRQGRSVSVVCLCVDVCVMFLTPLLLVCLGSLDTRMARTERRGREGGRKA